MVLTHTKVPLVIFNPLRDVLDAFNPLGDVSGVLVSFTRLRVFLSFSDAFLKFLLHLLPSGNPLGIIGIFFFFLN